ncbi:MAG: hypothetical protein CMI76_00620 [Candidatus Pelagibacter sp.]|nr:hypothetical protein [Candidatus Pelagibacter sp.]
MSSEQSLNIKILNDTKANLGESNPIRKERPARVNINHLLSKVREKEKSQKKENLVFFGVVGTVIVITGLIASL